MSDQGSPPAPRQPARRAESGGGFFAALFDFSFTRFVTPMIVKVAYVLAVIALGLGFVVFVIAGFNQGAGTGVLFVLLGGVGAFLYLLLIRMSLEFYVAIVRMSEDIHRRG